MKVKRYRAATMREALEKVKGELGENALVLGSKQVRNGGFLGLGAKEMVEVSVSSETPAKAKPGRRNEDRPPSRKSAFTSLSLHDDAPAAPARERSGGSAFSALAARVY